MNPEDSPLEKDVLESASKQTNISKGVQTLSEKDFRGNKPFLKTLPFWLWLFFIALLVALIIGTSTWYHQTLQQEESHEPFMEVTNREFSVFLWQFPSFLRVNVPKKTGYIPAFYFDRENFDPSKGNEFVSAPPDLIFLYHTWKRLLAPSFVSRPIKPGEFDEFLAQLTEWQPSHWQSAPAGYVQLIASKSYIGVSDLRTLSEDLLPMIVRQAFQGWKNYFKEGPEINSLKPTVKQIREFLTKYPKYARPFWRNISAIAGQEVAGLNYLQLLLSPGANGDEMIPNNQLSSFLKVALFNSQAKD
jgi:hypothetical protein